MAKNKYCTLYDALTPTLNSVYVRNGFRLLAKPVTPKISNADFRPLGSRNSTL